MPDLKILKNAYGELQLLIYSGVTPGEKGNNISGIGSLLDQDKKKKIDAAMETLRLACENEDAARDEKTIHSLNYLKTTIEDIRGAKILQAPIEDHDITWDQMPTDLDFEYACNALNAALKEVNKVAEHRHDEDVSLGNLFPDEEPLAKPVETYLPDVTTEVRNPQKKKEALDAVSKEDVKNLTDGMVIHNLNKTHHKTLGYVHENSDEYNRVVDTISRIAYMKKAGCDVQEVKKNYEVLRAYCEDYLNKRNPHTDSGKARFAMVAKTLKYANFSLENKIEVDKREGYMTTSKDIIKNFNLTGKMKEFIDDVDSYRKDFMKESLQNRKFLSNPKKNISMNDLAKFGMIVMFECNKNEIMKGLAYPEKKGEFFKLVEKNYDKFKAEYPQNVENEFTKSVLKYYEVGRDVGFHESEGINKLLFARNGEVVNQISDYKNKLNEAVDVNKTIENEEIIDNLDNPFVVK